MNWIPLTQLSEILLIAEKSHLSPCLIFKHSTSCSISFIAKHRLESNWTLSQNEILPYFLDLLSNRSVSDGVSEFFQVYHESPQIILIWEGEVLLEASHLDISIEEIMEMVRSVQAT